MALCLAVFDGHTHASSQQDELLHQRVNDQICFLVQTSHCHLVLAPFFLQTMAECDGGNGCSDHWSPVHQLTTGSTYTN